MSFRFGLNQIFSSVGNQKGLVVRRIRICLKLSESVRPEIGAEANHLLWFGAAKRRAECAALGVGPKRPSPR